MYGAVDIGGTKTLVAVFDENGKIVEQQKFPTPQNYEEFTKELATVVANMSTKEFQLVAVAVPGVVDRKRGVAKTLGNLPWEDVSIAHDIEKVMNCPVLLENDAKLAGLAEANILEEQYEKVLYITISTGIGIGLINKGVIDDAIGDTGGHDIYVEFDDQKITWEKLASGKAIFEKYGKKASEIDDPETWMIISRKIAIGLIDLIALLQPDIIVIGGGVGSHFEKYHQFLVNALKTYETPMTNLPKIVQAQHPEEAVIYGCYELMKHNNGKAAQ